MPTSELKGVHIQVTAIRSEQEEEIARDIADGVSTPIRLWGERGSGKSCLARGVARHLHKMQCRGYILIRVPSGVGQVQATVAELARRVSPDSPDEIITLLREAHDSPMRALEVLEQRLGDRKLIVDDMDELHHWPGAKDPEFKSLLGDHAHALAQWIEQHAALLIHSERSQGARPLAQLTAGCLAPLTPHGEAETQLKRQFEDLWRALGYNPMLFRLAISRALIRDRQELLLKKDNIGDDKDSIKEKILDDTWDHLSKELQHTVALASLHDRAVPYEIIIKALKGILPEPWRDTEIAEIIDTARQSLLLDIEEEGRVVVVPRPWSNWCKSRLKDKHSLYHHKLAKAFETTSQAPDYILEALRHLLAVPDLESAKAHAEQGVQLFLEQGWKLSCEQHRREEAAEIYDKAVQLMEMLSSKGEDLDKRWRAYAVHYSHFNRANSQGLRKTEDGYISSLKDWPENALFWSRLIYTQFLQHRPREALETLLVANKRVAMHDSKRYFLICRTVQRLLKAGGEFYTYAIVAWYELERWTASTSDEHLIQKKFLEALGEGWSCRKLFAPKGSDTVVHDIHLSREARFRVAKLRSNSFVFKCDQIRWLEGKGQTPRAAYQDYLAKLWREVLEYLKAFSHDLSERELRHKQKLLGLVDIVKSRLISDVPESIWVYGTLGSEMPDSELFFYAMESHLGKFRLESSLERRLKQTESLHEGMLRFARVRTGEAGQPQGPVEEVEDPVLTNSDENDTTFSDWPEWRES